MTAEYDRDGDEGDLLDFIPERLTEDEEGGANGGRGRSLLLASALIGLAVAGAAGWYVLADGTSGDGRVSAPLIPADDGPYKIRPADPGGMQVPNQDKLVYDRLDPAGEAPRPEVETLLPEPAPPTAPVVDSTPGTGTEHDTGTAGDTPTVPELPKAMSDGPMTPPPPPELDGEGKTDTGPKATGIATMEARPVPAGETGTAPKGTAPATAPQVTDTVPTTPEPAPRSGGTRPAASGAYVIQLAALRSEDAARKTWERLQGKYPDLLGPLTLHVERADLKEKGIFYRVRAAGLPSEDRAREVCAMLAKDKVGCLFVGKQ